jgi:hypothetical protein
MEEFSSDYLLLRIQYFTIWFLDFTSCAVELRSLSVVKETPLPLLLFHAQEALESTLMLP